MKKIIGIFPFLICVINVYAQTSLKSQSVTNSSLDEYLWSFTKNKAVPNQKPLVDFNVMDSWRGMGNDLAVSDDGNYFAYSINKMVFNAYLFGLYKVDSLIIQSTNNKQRTVLVGIKPGFFTADSKQYIYQDKTTLCFLQLGSGEIKKITDVGGHRLAQNQWLVYQLKDQKNLILQNLVTGKQKNFTAISEFDFDASGNWLVGKNNAGESLVYGVTTGVEKKFTDVVDYAFSTDGKALVIKTNKNLQYISLPQGQIKNIWTIKEKTGVSSYTMDASGKRVLFTVADSTNDDNIQVGYYEQGLDKAVIKVSNATAGLPKGVTISEASFTDNGRCIKLALLSKPVEAGKADDNLAGVEIWNSKDVNLQSVAANLNKRPKIYTAVVNIRTNRLVFLDSDDKKMFLQGGDFALVKKYYNTEKGDRFWEKREDSCWLISLKDGSSHLLPTKNKLAKFWFSPGGNYLVYFDADKDCHYFSYDLRSHTIKDITANVSENQLGFTYADNERKPDNGNLAAWVDNDAGLLVYDNYDIWKLDFTGKEKAINITNSFGSSGNIIFSLFSTDRYTIQVPVVKAKDPLVLRAYNMINKESGFYKKANLSIGAPEKLYMGNYFLRSIEGIQDADVESNIGHEPVKAKYNDLWIVERQLFNDARNYYATTDFKNFRRLTDFQPQKNYQWFTEELMSFKHLDGKTGQGILYKPENFDATKKYPVLIVLYGKYSNNLNQFPNPAYMEYAIAAGKTPLWFLNNGYLVFTPDIAVAPMKYGPKAYSVIEGAAQYLKTLPYVDANKLGTASHSWSAKLGAYIFTHSKSIAATSISEGYLYGNMINVALSSGDGGISKLDDVENGFQFGNLWQNKDRWIDQTTVLNVDKAISPLLLFCNKESSAEYRDQTFQFFNALRRLNKNAWWLNYDKGGHALADHNELRDYTMRNTQFFDHYLKYAPAPQWMTQGLSLTLKQIETGYALDPQGKCNPSGGEPCLICEAWNKQYQKTPAMFQKEIKDWTLDKDIAEELQRKQNERRKQLDKQGEIQTKEVLKMLNSK